MHNTSEEGEEEGRRRRMSKKGKKEKEKGEDHHFLPLFPSLSLLSHPMISFFSGSLGFLTPEKLFLLLISFDGFFYLNSKLKSKK